MKLKTLALASLLLSANLYAEEDNKYFQFGYEKVEFSHKDTDFKLSGNNFLNLTFGYHLSDYFAIELGGSIPLSTKVDFRQVDTHREWDGNALEVENFSEIEYDYYDTKFDAKPILRLGARVELPINDNFSFFSHIGYSATGIEWDGNGYEPFVDRLPADDVSQALLGQTPVSEITGKDNPREVKDNAVTLDLEGLTYGVGLRFNYLNGSNISFGYTKYINDDNGFESEGVNINYGWRF